jgi:plasmid maintenance system antidote protein VapI
MANPSQEKPTAQVRPVSLFDRDLKRAAEKAFDRVTGQLVGREQLKSYRQELAQYHLKPESKFENGDFSDRGTTHRRHVHATSVEHIGKEANRWEERLYVGLGLTAEIGYGVASEDCTNLCQSLKRLATQIGQRALARKLGISRSYLARLISGEALQLKSNDFKKVQSSLVSLFTKEEERTQTQSMMHSQLASAVALRGLTSVAQRLGVDTSNLQKVLAGRRSISAQLHARLMLI